MRTMKNKLLSLALALVLCLSLLPTAAYAAQDSDLEISFTNAIYSISQESFVRYAPEPASQDQCSADEYVTVCAIVKNNSDQAITLQNSCIRIDGGEELPWNKELTLEAGKSFRLHVYNANKRYLTPGLHSAVFYANGKALYSGHFSIGRAWSNIFKLPTAEQVAARPADARSPYVYTWLAVDKDVHYDAYCVDFKSDHIPHGTYSSMFSGYMDYSSLEKQYASVDTQGVVSLYCGLELWQEGKETDAFFRMWDIQCKDSNGNLTVIRPKQIYPEETGGTFDHEGTGVDSRIPYNWQAGRWYRMYLVCNTSEDTGNTTVAQWIQDLTTNEWTHICTYDSGVKNSGFVGSMAVFSENFFEQYAGGVRSLEFTNVRIHTDAGWQDVTSTRDNIRLQTSGSHQNAYGSWEAGADEHTFYMISTGVSGWGRTEGTGKLTIQNRESGSPLEVQTPAVSTTSTTQTSTTKTSATQTSTTKTSQTTGQFTDVAPNDYCAKAVAWAVEQNITSGTSKTTFSPDENCSAAQILTFLWRANGSPEPTGKTTPPNVNASDYYATAAAWAYEKGIVSGKTFNWNTPCTRSMAVTYIWKAAGSPAPSGSANFSDIFSKANYAQPVAWAVENGVTSGTTATTFSPNSICTRGQIVTFLYRALAD